MPGKEKPSNLRIGHSVQKYARTDSTNHQAEILARAGAEHGTAVVSDFQSRGKGRQGRKWQSPPGCNLYTSIILKPDLPPQSAPQITLVAGVAVAELLSRLFPGEVRLKWPNDVQIRGKKACGILTEMRSSGQSVEFVIMGIGLNVNIRNSEFDPAFRNDATSICEELGCELQIDDIASELYALVEKWYGIFLREGFAPVRASWLDYAGIIGREIKVAGRQGARVGTVLDLELDGSLLIREKGKPERVISGDITILGE